MSFAGQALIGAARGFDADFLVGPNRADTATVFSFAAGGMLEVPLTRHIGLRAAELEYVQSSLPNGADNQQRNIRIGAGIVFRIPLPDNRRSR
jgi:hypothetical protein